MKALNISKVGLNSKYFILAALVSMALLSSCCPSSRGYLNPYEVQSLPSGTLKVSEVVDN